MTAVWAAGTSSGSVSPVDLHRRPSSDVLVGPGRGQGVRWRPGERLEHLFEQRCDATPDRLAVDAGDRGLTFAELDAAANRLARYLLATGTGPGARVALLFDDPVQAYVGMLGALKAGAAYVPLDRAFPTDRVGYIVADAGVGTVLTLAHLREHVRDAGAAVLCLDEGAPDIAACDGARVTADERGAGGDPLAYVIYTSGSTGRPKGVAVEHPSIVNFVRVAADVYGVRPGDRMYQGLTIAFDFSVEEIWVPWVVGATLVPKPAGMSLLGVDLHEFLVGRDVTAMCCVPTLLATLEEDLPGLRFLLVSGEACPHDLIVRWHRPGRRFLNVYGPTEATVTATWTVVDPDRAVTIGVPLPTYSAVVLDPDPGPERAARALPRGEVGELGIAGVGLAVGYVNRDDLTSAAFVPDRIGLPDNPSGRIYRTGDLARIRDDGEIEYLGRIDLQVKIRGYRIELTEIESVMLQVPGIAQAVVDTHEPTAGSKELVGYYSLRTDADALDEDALLAHLRDHLPPYMIPAYLEHLPVIPMTANDKADRKALPAPTVRRTAGAREFVEPTGPTGSALAGLLAATLGLERVSAADHFFDDLGANSLLLARFAARVRKATTLPPISMRDMYLHPTITALATSVDARAGTEGPTVPLEVTRAGTGRYLLCGALQVLMFLATTLAAAGLLVAALEWLRDAATFVDMWQRSMVVTTAVFGGYFLLSVAAKWLLVRRWKAEEFPLWGWRYLRLWTVQRILRANPLAVFVGSPLFNVYLRALGARIGAGVVVLTRTVPVCTDLLTIGAGTVVRKDTVLNGYRAVAGRIQTGPVTIGADAVVGEQSVIDIGAVLGNRAQLGHASSLQTGQTIPDGESWHGSPAVPCDVDYRLADPARCGRLRRFGYAVWQLANVLLVSFPLALALVLQFLERIPLVPQLMQPGETAVGDPAFYVQVLGYVAVLLAVGIVVGLVFITTVPRLFHRWLREDAVYPLYGIRYWLYRVVSRSTNSRFYCFLFGDSSAILHYLRVLGYRFARPLVQSGSNFGVEVRHENPYLSAIGSGTMVSDGLSFMNAEFSNTSFRLRRAELGGQNFLGNNVAYPAGGRTGDNCLLATKVMVPIDGEVRSEVGLLGSPAFEIPRTVERDRAFDDLKTGDELHRRLRAKNRHNAVTAGIYLLALLVDGYVAAILGLLAFDYYFSNGYWTVAAATVAALLFSIGFHVLLERAVTSFRAMSPQFCSIYDRYFWWHERYWKMSAGTYLALFNGTPMKNVLWRLLGVRIGRRVFDDGCAMPEKTLVSIGNDAALNAQCTVQAHSLEDGAFKSDRIVIGPGVTLGPRAFVHYGTTLQEGAVVDADAFLMKGQEVPAFTRWRGNPAAETRDPLTAAPTPERDVDDPRGSGDGRTAAAPRPRILGIDVARGVALLGMMAVHAFPTFGEDGRPTEATVLAAGRSAAAFVLIAGVSLALISGGRSPVRGHDRIPVAAGLVVRAALVAALGLSLGMLEQSTGISGILPVYAMLFVLAIPLVARAPLTLVGIAAAVVALGPLLLVATVDAALPYDGFEGDPTWAMLGDPLGLLVLLFVTGAYPIVVYLAYLCAGLAIGRLDLRSRRVAWWLLAGGAALAVTARIAALVLLYPLGGLAQLAPDTAPADGAADAVTSLLWDPETSGSWWYLALPAPHSHTPVELVHDLGSAMAVLGAALLLTRVPAVSRLLRPLALAGAMALTLYTAHLLVLATGVWEDRPALLYALLVTGSLAFAWIWRRWFRQGPLERIVTVTSAQASAQARRAAATLTTGEPTAGAGPDAVQRPALPTALRATAQFVQPLVAGGALALAFWVGASTTAAPPRSDVDSAATAPADDAAADTGDPAASPGEPAGLERYCELSEQVTDLDDRYPDQPEVLWREAGPQLVELARIAPVEIRDAVATQLLDLQVEAGASEAEGPDDATIERAEAAIGAFDDRNC